MTLIAELRRRKVVRIALIYAVAAWGVLQAADVLGALAGMSDWALRVVLLILILGFPVALVLAWVFKLTPAGIERDSVSEGRNLRPVSALPIPLAILPFRNTGDGDSDKYLADGLTEEVLSALAAFGAVRIPAGHACCPTAAGQADLHDIAETLPVSHALRGTVRNTAGRVHVAAELLDVTSGARAWSQDFDSTPGEIFQVGDAIGQAVTQALGVGLPERVLPNRAFHTEAYVSFLKGRHALNAGTAAGCHEAVRHFTEALAADPSLARAHAGITQAYHWLASYGSLSPDEGFVRARAAAARALALDRNLAEAHLALGQVQFGYEWDFAGAGDSFRRALALAPANAEVHRHYGHFLQMMGRHDEALAMRREAVRLDPLSLPAHLGVADSSFCAGRSREALRELEKIVEMDPEFPVHHLRARIELARGRPREALREVRKDPLAWRRHYISAIAHHRLSEHEHSGRELRALIDTHGAAAALQIALVYSQTGDKDQALRWLERAYEQRDPGMIELKADPEFSPLRSDARFLALEQKMGLCLPADNATVAK